MTEDMRPAVSIICPAYNEAGGIAEAIGRLRRCLDALDARAEVLIINDGSTDATAANAIAAIGADHRFRVLTHRANFGRGRAMRTGFGEAVGEIIVTTEADLSWGEDIISQMVKALADDPRLDAVFASPHLPGGGYRNVPWHRVMLSRWGNIILRTLYPAGLTMTTGMTRAYRASVIQGQRFTKEGKELHLEIAHRLRSMGCTIGEVPATLSWPLDTELQTERGRRTDWKKIRRLIASHLAFGILQGISRIIVPSIVFLSAAILGFGAWAIHNVLEGEVSILLVILTGLLMVLWMNLTVGYFLLRHLFHIEANIWRLEQTQSAGTHADRQYYWQERAQGR